MILRLWEDVDFEQRLCDAGGSCAKLWSLRHFRESKCNAPSSFGNDSTFECTHDSSAAATNGAASTAAAAAAGGEAVRGGGGDQETLLGRSVGASEG